MNVYTYLYRAYSEDFIYRDFTGKSMSSVLMIVAIAAGLWVSLV